MSNLITRNVMPYLILLLCTLQFLGTEQPVIIYFSSPCLTHNFEAGSSKIRKLRQKSKKKTCQIWLVRREKWAEILIAQQEKYFTSTVLYSNKPHSAPAGGLWLTICLGWATTVREILPLCVETMQVKSDAGECCKSFVSGNAGWWDAGTSALMDDELLCSLALV